MVPPAKILGMGVEEKVDIFCGRMVGMATNITLTTEEFALLFEYLDREHTQVWDPNTVGQTTKIGKKLWDRVQKIAVEQGFTPTHTPINEGSVRHKAGPS